MYLSRNYSSHPLTHAHFLMVNPPPPDLPTLLLCPLEAGSHGWFVNFARLGPPPKKKPSLPKMIGIPKGSQFEIVPFWPRYFSRYLQRFRPRIAWSLLCSIFASFGVCEFGHTQKKLSSTERIHINGKLGKSSTQK